MFQSKHSSNLGQREYKTPILLSTPKIPYGFWQHYASLDMVGEVIFFQKLKVKTKRSNSRILKLFCCRSTLKCYSPSFHGVYKIITFNHQCCFFLGHFSQCSSLLQNSQKIRNLHNLWNWLPNQVDHTWLNVYPQIKKYERTIIILAKGVLNQNLNNNFLEKREGKSY